mgnify:CR=1 FL=1
MNGNCWIRVGLSALVQGIITAGTALTVAESAGTITETGWYLAIVGGMIAAAKDVQAHLTEPPQ